MKLRITHPFEDTGDNMPSFYDRINDNIYLRRPTVILIDGKSQTGKTTIGRDVCKKYDNDYKIVFTVDQLLEYLLNMRDKCFKGYDENHKKIWVVPNEIMFKWILFDEPQLDIPKERWQSDRNLVITLISSGFGFLNPQMIMCLPNISGIRDTLYTNLLFRMTISSYLTINRDIKRKAIIRKPYFDERSKKYKWSMPVEEHTIPFIERDKEYENRKYDNFFDVQLPKWVNLITGKDILTSEKEFVIDFGAMKRPSGSS